MDFRFSLFNGNCFAASKGNSTESRRKIKNEAFRWNTDDWFNLIRLPMKGTSHLFSIFICTGGLTYDFRFKAEKKKEKKKKWKVCVYRTSVFVSIQRFFSTSIINIISHRRDPFLYSLFIEHLRKIFILLRTADCGTKTKRMKTKRPHTIF